MKRKRSRVVIDPERAQVWREAWDLLLTDRYTLRQICIELHKRGYTRKSGLPWVWKDPETGHHEDASSQLHRSFHNAFYAGWVTSEAYDVVRGDVLGHWEPIVTDEEFSRGIEILRRRDVNKQRIKRHVYALSGLIRMQYESEEGPRLVKVYGSTPTGRSRSYSYYTSVERIEGRKQQVRTEVVEEHLPGLLAKIALEPKALPGIRAAYHAQLGSINGPDVATRIADLQRRMARLKDEEASLARLYAQGRLSDENYDNLRAEWLNKVFEAQRELGRLEEGLDHVADDLEQALELLARVPALYERLDPLGRRGLLQILIHSIIIDTQGAILRVELNAPFAFLLSLKPEPGGRRKPRSGSTKLPTSQPTEKAAGSEPGGASFCVDGDPNSCLVGVQILPVRDGPQVEPPLALP